MENPVKLLGKYRGYLIVVVAIGLIGLGGFYFFDQYQKSKVAQGGADDVKKTVESIAKLIELPTGETPTLATVSDKSKLSSEAFFAKAENGDKVLLFSQAKKAFLYRPSTNKIIEVATLNVPVVQNTNTQTNQNPVLGESVSTTPIVSPVPVSLTVLNGTKTKGLANTVATQIETKDSSLVVKTKANAASDYKQTLVVSLTDAGKAKAGDVASIVGGTVGELPAGESKPATDIVVIIGGN